MCLVYRLVLPSDSFIRDEVQAWRLVVSNTLVVSDSGTLCGYKLTYLRNTTLEGVSGFFSQTLRLDDRHDWLNPTADIRF